MEEIKKQLFELIEKHDSKEITDQDCIMSFCNVLQNNNRSINIGQVSHLIDIMLNDQIFDND